MTMLRDMRKRKLFAAFYLSRLPFVGGIVFCCETDAHDAAVFFALHQINDTVQEKVLTNKEIFKESR